MPRIAVIADIHGNLPALEAVIEDIASSDVDEVLVGGDLVGRGPSGHDVIDRLRRLGWEGIRGNHEDYLLSFRHAQVPEAWLTSKDWAMARWIAAEVTAEDVAYLEALPPTRTAKRDGDLRLWHGTPRSNREGIGAWTDDETLEAILALVSEPLLVVGHTHRSFDQHLGGQRVVNVGSVGLPFNGDWRSQYAIFARERGQRAWQVEMRKVEYDREAQRRAFETSGFLRAAGVGAHLLLKELEHARPFLVPFLKWVAVESRAPDEAAMEVFLEAYNPHGSLRAWFEAMRERNR